MEVLTSLIVLGIVVIAGAAGSLWWTRKVRLRAEPAFEAVVGDDLPEAATKSMGEVVTSLTPTGFAVEANVRLPEMGEDADLLLMAFVQRSTQTVAICRLTIKSGDADRALSVQTRLADGTLIETGDHEPTWPLPRRKGVRSLAITRKLDHVHPIEPADFISLHASRVSRCKQAISPLPPDMAAYLQEQYRAEMRWLLSTGYFRRRGEWLTLSWRGRLMIALRSNIFVAQFRNIRRELATDRVLSRWRKYLAVERQA